MLFVASTAARGVRSPVELSLSPLFRRQYSSSYAAVDYFFVPTSCAEARVEHCARELRLLRLLAELLPRPQPRTTCNGRPPVVFKVQSAARCQPSQPALFKVQLWEECITIARQGDLPHKVALAKKIAGIQA